MEFPGRLERRRAGRIEFLADTFEPYLPQESLRLSGMAYRGELRARVHGVSWNSRRDWKKSEKAEKHLRARVLHKLC